MQIEYGINLYNRQNNAFGMKNGNSSAQGEAAQYANPNIHVKINFNQKDPLGSLKKAYNETALKQMGIVECATCAARKYQDGSNDPGVSFKAPTYVSPGQSGAVVRAHEQEHVSREQSKVEQNGGQVISQSVQIFMSTCPECGRAYTSGGVTRTTVRYNQKQDETQFKGKLLDAVL